MTLPQDRLLELATALTPETVLRRLVDAGTAGEAPEVSVHLAGGQVLGGRPVRVDTDLGQDVVLLATAGGAQLTYALLASVVAVEVHQPERVRDVLTEGPLAPPVTEPVTRLALRRDFPHTREFPVQLDWAELPHAGPELANLDRLLRALRQIADHVRADDMGRQAWARIDALRVAHYPGAPLSVLPAQDGLLVRADLSATLPRDLTAELGRQIDALL